jgi:hypothetical protein
VLTGAALLLGALWVVPPLLDWNRFRHAIATIAGADLGRAILINGDVALRLLPAPILTATDVDLPDPGDGTSAHLAALRLEVALGPLLRGRLVVRDLVLGSPVVSVPWPLPASMIRPARPSVPHAFAAHVENGTLRSGQAEISGINAAIHGGPEAGLAQDGPVTSFGAEGFAAFDGQRWRFTAALGAPDADNVSAVDVAVQGQGAAHDTGGAVVGTLSDGVLQGRLHAAGSDLSLLIPASRLAWRAEAPFIATSDRIESSVLSLRLGASPATASFALHLMAPARLEAALHAASLDLDGWSRLVRGRFAGFMPPVPVRLAFDADEAALLGGRIGTLGGVLTYDGSQWALDQVQAKLPGGAQLAFSGRMSRTDSAMLSVDGPASLNAPDLRSTLAWVRPLAPELVGALSQGGEHRAELNFTAHVAPDLASLRALTGKLDGGAVDGQVEARIGAHPSVTAKLHAERLDLDDWLGRVEPRPGTSLADLAKPFTMLESKVELTADTAVAGGRVWSGLALSASSGLSGLRLETASASAGGLHVTLSGALAPDGTVTGARLKAIAPDLKTARTFIATGPDWAWGAVSALPGPASLQAFADGPPNALTLQLRAEAADLTAEADSRRDTLTGAADTTMTLRHPGASFLLDALGARQADRWLGLGPLAVLAHVHSTSGAIDIRDITLSAADMQLHGIGSVTFRGAEDPSVDLDLSAPVLALPAFGMVSPPRLDLPRLLSGWRGDIRLRADQVEAGLQPVPGTIDAALSAGGGDMLLTADNTGQGAMLSLAVAVDASRRPAAVAVQARVNHAALTKAASLPLRIAGGHGDLILDLSAAGDTTPALLGSLSGNANLTLRNADIDGIDLPAVNRLAAAGAIAPSRGAMQLALTSGLSDNISGVLQARFEGGRLAIGDNAFSSIDGSFRLRGTADLANGVVDVTNEVSPALPGTAPLAVRYAGESGAMKAIAELGAYGETLARPDKPRKPRAAR